jgi:anti-sigma factor RsiW
MTMTPHVTDQLSDYLDDELTADQRQAVEGHLASCLSCTSTLAELRRVAVRARDLADIAPRAELWSGIATRIGAAGAAPPVHRTSWRVALSLPQLAAAAALLVALGGGVVWQFTAPSGPTGDPVGGATFVAAPAAATAYDQAVVRLEGVLRERRDQLDARTVQVLEESLLTIDRAILRAQAALEADPGDSYLRTHLAETRQRKLSLLRQVATLTVSS